jgi:alpha-galactosidase
LQEWVSLFQRFKPLLHTGRVIRVDPSDPAVQINGVIAADRGEALIAHVQLAESAHNRGVAVRLPGLEPERRYTTRWVGPVDSDRISYAPNVHPDGPARGAAIPGSVLATHGIWIPRRRAETILLMHLQAVG